MIQARFVFKLNIDENIVLPDAVHEITRTDDPELAIHVATNTIRFIRRILEAHGVDVRSVNMLEAFKTY